MLNPARYNFQFNHIFVSLQANFILNCPLPLVVLSFIEATQSGNIPIQTFFSRENFGKCSYKIGVITIYRLHDFYSSFRECSVFISLRLI